MRACVHSVGMLCGYMPNSSFRPNVMAPGGAVGAGESIAITGPIARSCVLDTAD